MEQGKTNIYGQREFGSCIRHRNVGAILLLERAVLDPPHILQREVFLVFPIAIWKHKQNSQHPT
ncbi:hypothetical protein F441_05140 [Phytophthora nicotianae CJ01A1]|uniref:Uncharacterized protein n=5 Tax=Phytophthora nicotianae TaxID=4792 RepID=W2QJ19_PHYN3|nr:hypothetical protein PPTG_09341 [Phytophthora nicotianae INRA-310]ETI51551.1 hypothetical protein F443_05140 [Phytophthora nicotianae P1569]ETM51125.1 hypothetical protein L914_04957 [Phytophthora nicotianae]ETP21285.1 hypothetical protein F441_05140 [Phytophthora nicotianae CJ01A1]ETP49212.1 hypothetical protein F442_05197 [Phytophthora nicotianae P10297]ETN12564.1 hypothetical protein PPTG_09341 [Phytophthora nicotianae INRA-310]